MNPLSKLTVKDRQALMLYLGIVLLCATFFAAGIFIGYSTSHSSAAMETEGSAAGFTVRIFGLNSAESAQELSVALRAQRHVEAVIETAPGIQGYAVKAGPFATRAAADDVVLELRNAGYHALTTIAETQGR